MSLSNLFPAVWPAPMEGAMHPAFVAAVNELELTDVWLTPFFRVTNVKTPKKQLAAFLKPFTGRVPVYVQLMGHDSGSLAAAAETVMELGATGVNLNFGCPSKVVMRHSSGGGLLRCPDDILRIVREVKMSVPSVPLSIKARSGFDSYLNSWYSDLTQLDIQAVFLHFRTVREGYGDIPFEVALERFRLAKERVGRIPLIANGDIDSAEKQSSALSCGADGVMAGRGWFRKPDLLRVLAGKDSIEAADRKLFFKVIEIAKNEDGIRFGNGRAIELATLIWGRSNPILEELKSKNDGAWKNLTEEIFDLK